MSLTLSVSPYLALSLDSSQPHHTSPDHFLSLAFSQSLQHSQSYNCNINLFFYSLNYALAELSIASPLSAFEAMLLVSGPSGFPAHLLLLTGQVSVLRTSTRCFKYTWYVIDAGTWQILFPLPAEFYPESLLRVRQYG